MVFQEVSKKFQGSLKSFKFQGFFKIVSKVFQERLNCILRVFEVTSKGISGKFQRYFEGVPRQFFFSRKIEGCFNGVLSGFQACLNEVEWVFEGSFQSVSRMFSGHFKDVSRKIVG